MKKQTLYTLLFVPFLIFSQIQINEIFADNGDCCLDDSLETEDFIELINIGNSPIDLAGYYFGDQDGGSTIPSGYPALTTISAGDFLLLWFDNDLEQGPLHIDAKLNNDGETIVAYDSEGNTVINVTYGPQIEDVSFAAFPDGQVYDDGWEFTMCPTPGLSNDACPLVEGCTSFNAANYNSNATIEDGSCIFGTFSGLMINEYSAANCNNDGGDCGDYEDWVEILNNTSEAIDLEGYYLSDKIDNLIKWQFPNSTIIAPGEHLIVYASGLDPDLEVSSNNTSFKLTQTKNNEYIILSNSDSEIIDYKKLTPHQLNHSVGRSFDASSDWSIFTNSTPGSINENQTAYEGYTALPYFSYEAGFYGDPIILNINCDFPNTEIYYTLDGSLPDENSIYYGYTDASGTLITGDNISIDETTVVRAVGISQGSNSLNSFVESSTYFINESHTVMVLSIAGETVDDLLNGQGWMRPQGSFELFDSSGLLMDKAVGEFNEHGNDSWAYSQRGFDYITRDQYGYNYAINDKIFTTKDRESFQRLILKAGANDNYPFTGGSPAHIRDSYVHSLSQIGDLRMDERSHESCVLYVNGEYWGVYDVREKVDDLDFLDYYYDQGEGYVDFLKTWGGTWIEFGDNTTDDEWDNLVNFITNNDMTDPDNYNYVKGVYNTGSLIDYFILNSYVVCMDWLNWNTGWWRGKHPEGDKKKWRYILWDMDATFGHYINYTGIPDTGSGADPCDPESLGDPGGQGHVPILNALLDNDEFMADYINRYADLSNTIFSCDFMINHLDSLIAIIEPEMSRQIDRWGGSFSQWENNVEELREFILERCSDEFVEGMEECYDVEAMDITIIIEGEGEVEINSIDLVPENSPWTGTYYSGLPIQLSASTNDNGAFNFYWEVVQGDLVLIDPTNPEIIFDLSSSLTIIANFDACESVPTDEIIGPSIVEEGSIWQYTFPSEFTNTSEWSVTGGEVLFTSSLENTIGIQWNFGSGEGQIVLSQYNFEGLLECLFVDIQINEAAIKYNCVNQECIEAQGGQYGSLDDCLMFCDDNTGIDNDSFLNNNLIVFPNPATDQLSLIVTSETLTGVELYNINGKKVHSCLSCDGRHKDSLIELDVSHLSAGVYVLIVESATNQSRKKVTIK
ncbi:MAG: hypothetical protein CMP50_01545 [Flavobacteriales bacterium]|nr:hypothetical protein [Flavobacteriales bacterium]